MVGGLPGSLLFVNPSTTLLVSAGSTGYAALPVNVPSTPSLIGVEMSFQLFDFDISLLGTYSLPLGHSRGMTVRIDAP
jgi:hypothetical protein